MIYIFSIIKFVNILDLNKEQQASFYMYRNYSGSEAALLGLFFAFADGTNIFTRADAVYVSECIFRLKAGCCLRNDISVIFCIHEQHIAEKGGHVQ